MDLHRGGVKLTDLKRNVSVLMFFLFPQHRAGFYGTEIRHRGNVLNIYFYFFEVEILKLLLITELS